MKISLLSGIGVIDLNEAFTKALAMAESEEISESQRVKNDHQRKEYSSGANHQNNRYDNQRDIHSSDKYSSPKRHRKNFSPNHHF